VDPMSRRERQPLLGVRGARRSGNQVPRGALNAVSNRSVGMMSTGLEHACSVRVLTRPAGSSEELHDRRKRLSIIGLSGRRRRCWGSDPEKLPQKRGTTLAYATADSKSRERFAGAEEYAGFWLYDPREKMDLLDFGVIEKPAATGEPRFMQWYGAYGLMLYLWQWLIAASSRVYTPCR
jgi:hypothetical protein